MATAIFLTIPEAHATSTVPITITSSPIQGSGYVTVDGSNITTPATFNWNVGETHTVEANSPVIVVSDQSQYAYSNWSDGEAQIQTIIVPSQPTTYTVTFQLQYHLSVSSGNEISYSNPQPGNWYNAGATTSVSTEWAYNSTEANEYVSKSSGTVLWLPFDEGSGTTTRDFSGNGNNGKIYGASWVNGDYGDALSFDGTSSYVDCGNAASLQVQNAFTLCCWFNSANNAWRSFLDKGWTNAWSFGQQNSKLFFLNGGAVLSGTLAFSTGVWNFGVVTYDGATLRFYLNGVFDTSYNITCNFSQGNNLWIGKNLGGGFYAGIVDEVRVYNRALPASEIQAGFQQAPDFSSYVLANVPMGTTQVITTLSWQGTGSINVTITSPSQTYTENMMSEYQKTVYSTTGGGPSSMLNIKRLSISVNALSSDQRWNITLTYDTVTAYQMTVEVQK
jgi:hypothetical protein